MYLFQNIPKKSDTEEVVKLPALATLTPTLVPTITPTIIPITPTQKILSFSEMNSLYGPCVSVSVLMYHHVQSKESSVKEKNTSFPFFDNRTRELRQNYVLIEL